MAEANGITVPIAVRSVIKACVKHGMAAEEIAMYVGIAPNTVRGVIADLGGQKSLIADAAAEDLKRDLPSKLRVIASLMADRLASPEMINGMNGRDLAVSLGILLDKALLLDQGGNQTNILVTIQTRVDSSMREALGAATPKPAIEAEVVEVVPCTPIIEKKGAPRDLPKVSPGNPHQKPVRKRVR